LNSNTPVWDYIYWTTVTIESFEDIVSQYQKHTVFREDGPPYTEEKLEEFVFNPEDIQWTLGITFDPGHSIYHPPETRAKIGSVQLSKNNSYLLIDWYDKTSSTYYLTKFERITGNEHTFDVQEPVKAIVPIPNLSDYYYIYTTDSYKPNFCHRFTLYPNNTISSRELITFTQNEFRRGYFVDNFFVGVQSVFGLSSYESLWQVYGLATENPGATNFTVDYKI
jgi:protease II